MTNVPSPRSMATIIDDQVLTESASSSDVDLMERVASGDLEAFEQLVLRHQERAWAVAWHMLSDAAEAEDAVQEAFLKVLRSASRYRPMAAFRTYLHHVLIRVCLDVRSKRRPDYTPEPLDVADQGGTPEELLRKRERSAAVRRALAGLPPRHRAAIVLRHYEDLSYEEIAGVLRVSSKAVDSLLQRARRSLRSKLSSIRF